MTFMRSKKNKSARGRRLREVIARWGNRCFYCGYPFERGGKATLDHYWPLAKGGADDATNIVPACETCNKGKGCEAPTRSSKWWRADNLADLLQVS